MNNKTIL